MKPIFNAIMGSRAYGTSIKKSTTSSYESDYDFRGVGIELDLAYYFGFKKVNQIEDKLKDKVMYDVRKFISLAKDGNPNILEILFMDNKDLILHQDPTWTEMFIPAREYFLTKKVKHAYKGYAKSQWVRILRHRKWFTKPPPEPKPEDFFYEPPKEMDKYKEIFMEYKTDDDKNRIKKYIDNLKSTKNLVLIKCHNNAKMEFFFRNKRIQEQGKLFDRAKYEVAVKTYHSYTTWRKNRNEKRAALENKYGYDTKHGYHSIRLLDQAEDILVHNTLRVCRPDRVELWNEIRQGKVPFEKFERIYTERYNSLEKWTENSTLPSKPNYNRMEQFSIEVIKEFLKRNGIRI